MRQAAGKLEGVRTRGRGPRGAPGADARQLELFSARIETESVSDFRREPALSASLAAGQTAEAVLSPLNEPTTLDAPRPGQPLKEGPGRRRSATNGPRQGARLPVADRNVASASVRRQSRWSIDALASEPFHAGETRLVDLAELPRYAASDIEMVDQIIGAWPATKALFTYGEIHKSFGLSRATVARKVKCGLVPGIAFAGERVLADGPVRRFTREQLKYLLLAVRTRR